MKFLKNKTFLMGLGLLAVIAASALAFFSTQQASSEFQLNSQSEEGSLPGVGPLPPDLLEKFEQKKKTLGPDYKPRTRHLNKTGWAKYTNRLFLETSPYLLQHAHNPVNWYPWGDEAFKQAKKLNRPVLLSVGYSTCHWCHVMEEESFEDEDIAKFLNENYIAIKVDREERPDVDAIYMSAVRAITRGGGWPMTVWLTPDRKPFYGGTYFPPRQFLAALQKLKKAYEQQPDKITESSEQLANIIQQMLQPPEEKGIPDAEVLHQAMEYYKKHLDSNDGGLSEAPKFPSSLPLRFLLRYHRRCQDEEALHAVTLTLDKMASGGIYDHIGGGFHRYSTDKKWLVPHFEKMLYDNALLVLAYLKAYKVTGDQNYKRVVEEILRYIKRDMTSPNGVFYSATDADSLNPHGHREEGWFFTWTPQEIQNLLKKDEAKLFQDYYAVSSKGNFEGRNILHTPKPLSEVAKKYALSEPQARKIIKRARARLYKARSQRPPPLRDEKILTAWNGLMISAYAQAGFVLHKKNYIETAQKAAQFILNNLYQDGRLSRTYKDGKAKLNAYLDDYAFFISALLDLYETTFEIKWLKMAIRLDNTLEKHFEDSDSGGFFRVSDDHEKLLAREKPAYDGAVPSGNSVAVYNLLRLHELTTKASYYERAKEVLRAFSGTLKSHPAALSEMLLAVDFYLDKAKEIIIVTPEGKKEKSQGFLSELREHYLPNRVLAVVEFGDDLKAQSQWIPLVKYKRPIQGKTTAYVCENRICRLPTSDPEIFAKQISVVDKLENCP